LIFQYFRPPRIRLTADRGFPDDDLFALLDQLKVKYIIRVKGSTKVNYRGTWLKLNRLRFEGNARRRSLGRIEYCQDAPRKLWVTMSRARNKKGKWGIWYLVSNLPLRAELAVHEYGFRFDCEEGFRDSKWDLGFAEARVKQIDAWSRLFASFATALMALTALGMKLLVRGGAWAQELPRRVTSRRRHLCVLSLIAAVIALVQKDKTLFAAPSAHTKLKLDYVL
jgi:Transposase DDE domain